MEDATEKVYRVDYCTTCEKQFKDATARKQHIQNSAIHGPGSDMYCEECCKSFQSREGLEHHKLHSNYHRMLDKQAKKYRKAKPASPLNPSGESILKLVQKGIKAELQSHQETFQANQVESQAMQGLAAEISQTGTDTPVDIFFRSYKGFDYDPKKPPAESYEALMKSYGWFKGHPSEWIERDRFMTALLQEVAIARNGRSSV